MERRRLGVITGGAFNDGLIARLDEERASETLQIGDFCVVEGEENLYFSIIQELRLEATDARMMGAPPADLSPFMRRALRGTSTYAVAEVKPMLMVRRPELQSLSQEEPGPRPVRTIPMHFSHLVEASQVDFATVFGEDRGTGTHFAMGSPLTMEMPIPINLQRLVERSSGIFGSTGTGKSFLTRILLGGVISRGTAVNLIFDMHNEYAYGKESEEGERVKGLKELFGSKVVVYTLDPTSRSSRADHDLAIRFDDIEAGDVLSLGKELGLSTTNTDTNLSMLVRRFDDHWLRSFLEMGPAAVAAFSDEVGGHTGSLQALHRKLLKLQDRPYVHAHVQQDVFKDMMGYLDRGRHVILHFGKNDDVLDQMIVANMVTRRIRELYQAKTEAYQLSGNKRDKPRPLLITVEEAHRFLSPELAAQTIFGTIARELRKYYVTLLIVDQRPSGIDDEILSQVGTRISGKLLDDRDLEAVLSGTASRAAIRAGLASLDTKQQVMIFGHAVPMPIALRTRRYDNQFYQEVTRSGPGVLELYGPAEADKLPDRELVSTSGAGRSAARDSLEDEINMLFGGGDG
jgi:uncharacterized protein